MRTRIRGAGPLRGEVTVPGDKSISHRAAILGAMACGETEVTGFLEGEDPLSTVRCLRDLGVQIEGPHGGRLLVTSGGVEAWREPAATLDAGNSGTTFRLLLGALAGRGFPAILTGDQSLRRRPMGRVAEPLRSMGAAVGGADGGKTAPLTIRGGKLHPAEVKLAMSSAQVKSAILLAGLQTEGSTSVTEPSRSRDHTERMLAPFGGQVEEEALPDGRNRVTVRGAQVLRGTRVAVPGDFSAAAFFLVAGAVVPGARITMRGVGLNPTRTGLLDVLRRMGANIRVEFGDFPAGGEPVGDVTVEGMGSLSGVEIGGELIPRMIDEIPVLAVAAAFAHGETVIRDAAELRAKESDRIAAMAAELARLGVRVRALPDGLVIQGGGDLRGGDVDSWGDHRVAMALAVAACAAGGGETLIQGTECVDISYPGFFTDLTSLGAETEGD